MGGGTQLACLSREWKRRIMEAFLVLLFLGSLLAALGRLLRQPQPELVPVRIPVGVARRRR